MTNTSGCRVANMKAIGEMRRDELGVDAAAVPAETLADAFRLQSARKGDEAERCFVSTLLAERSCGAAWYGRASLLHEYQHGGLTGGSARRAALAEAADAALIAARNESRRPRSLALLGDILNDQDDHREACRAWRAAEERGRTHWRSLASSWLDGSQSAFGPMGHGAVDSIEVSA